MDDTDRSQWYPSPFKASHFIPNAFTGVTSLGRRGEFYVIKAWFAILLDFSWRRQDKISLDSYTCGSLEFFLKKIRDYCWVTSWGQSAANARDRAKQTSEVLRSTPRPFWSLYPRLPLISLLRRSSPTSQPRRTFKFACNRDGIEPQSTEWASQQACLSIVVGLLISTQWHSKWVGTQNGFVEVSFASDQL